MRFRAEQFFGADLERPAKFFEDVEPGVACSLLDHPDLIAVQFCFVGQVFLSPLAFTPKPTRVVRQALLEEEGSVGHKIMM